MTRQERARLAGSIVGDGNIAAYNNVIKVNVVAGTPGQAEDARLLTGVGYAKSWTSRKGERRYGWYATGSSAYEVLKYLLPYLTEKVGQAKKAIAYYERQLEYGWRKKLTPEERALRKSMEVAHVYGDEETHAAYLMRHGPNVWTAHDPRLKRRRYGR